MNTSFRSSDIVAFLASDDGRMNIISNRSPYFLSLFSAVDSINERHVKEAVILGTRWRRGKKIKLVTSPHWKNVPIGIRTKLKNGFFPVSSSIEHGDASTKDAIDAFHFITSPLSHREGRTGVLGVWSRDLFQPYLVRIKKKPYVIEVKGCGTAMGGFGKSHFRTSGSIKYGMVDPVQARDEFEHLQEEERNDGPIALAYLLTQDVDGTEIGIILRATPSTLRASYVGGQSLPSPSDAQHWEWVRSKANQLFIDHLHAPYPLIMNRSYHVENLLMLGNGAALYTDYCGHAPFADPTLPHIEPIIGFVGFRKLLAIAIDDLSGTPGYQRPAASEYWDLLKMYLKAKGQNVPLTMKTFHGVKDYLWKHIVSPEIFLARLNYGYQPSEFLPSLRRRAEVLIQSRRDGALLEARDHALEFLLEEKAIGLGATGKCRTKAEKKLADQSVVWATETYLRVKRSSISDFQKMLHGASATFSNPFFPKPKTLRERKKIIARTERRSK